MNDMVLYLSGVRKLKLFFSILALIISIQGFAQENTRIENGMQYKPSLVQPFIHELYQKNDFVILFRNLLPDKIEFESSYFVFAGKGDQFTAYTYSLNKPGLVNLNLSISKLNLIWKTFEQNELFKIRDEKDIPNFCAKKYDIYGSYTYEFTILSKGYMKILSYYNPEYYTEVCYGISERQNIINSAAIINRLYFDN